MCLRRSHGGDHRYGSRSGGGRRRRRADCPRYISARATDDGGCNGARRKGKGLLLFLTLTTRSEEGSKAARLCGCSDALIIRFCISGGGGVGGGFK